jgi:uncharacterized protein
MAPVDVSARMQYLDAIRGVALFTVLWMNFNDNARFNVPNAVINALPTVDADRWVGFFTSWLVARKAQALFSILFGFGFALFMERVRRAGSDGIRLYLRRLLLLLLFGACHVMFIFLGDILYAYALMGLLLLCTLRWPRSALLFVGIALSVSTSLAVHLLNPVFNPFHQTSAGAAFLASQAQRFVVFQGNDYALYRAELWRFVVELYSRSVGIPFLLTILGRFLIGAWLFRAAWLTGSSDVLRRRALWLIGAGLPIAAVRPLFTLLGKEFPRSLNLLWSVPELLSQILLAVGYAVLIALLYRSRVGERVSRHFTSVGQMALTNYLCQSLAYLFVLYGFGLGWLKFAGPTFSLAATLVLFPIQMWFSSWWLRRFRFGPAEWLWRSGTYGRVQPLRR